MSPLDRFLRALLILASAGAPALLFYGLGWWAVAVLAAIFIGVASFFLFSTGKARGAEIDQSGERTGYRNTSIF